MTVHSTYASAGVDIGAGQRAVDLMTKAVRATYSREVLAGIGAFGGLFDASRLKEMEAPVLVASTDGVGTKTKVASKLGRWDTIGCDLVNHCINDILVQGAEPLFFMDYVASSHLDAEQIATVVGGVAAACRDAGCSLLGGETAEMPGVYEAGELDLAGTIIGVVERSKIIDGRSIVEGDIVWGLPSTGLHTNGFSLARRVLADLDWSRQIGNSSIADALLAIHHPYLQAIRKLWSAGVVIKGMAHVTGGGFVDNLPRILPENVGAVIKTGSWPILPIFELIQNHGKIETSEMFHVFNMGIGMLIVIDASNTSEAIATLTPHIYQVGNIIHGTRNVCIL